MTLEGLKIRDDLIEQLHSVNNDDVFISKFLKLWGENSL